MKNWLLFVSLWLDSEIHTPSVVISVPNRLRLKLDVVKPAPATGLPLAHICRLWLRYEGTKMPFGKAIPADLNSVNNAGQELFNAIADRLDDQTFSTSLEFGSITEPSAEFILELVAAANSGEVPVSQKCKLLEQAIVKIQLLRTRVHKWPSANVKDAVACLKEVSVAASTGSHSPDRTNDALLDAAVMIRDLQYQVDMWFEYQHVR